MFIRFGKLPGESLGMPRLDGPRDSPEFTPRICLYPTRTVSIEKVNLAAFRTYTKVYKPLDEGPSE